MIPLLGEVHGSCSSSAWEEEGQGVMGRVAKGGGMPSSSSSNSRRPHARVGEQEQEQEEEEEEEVVVPGAARMRF